MRIIPKSMVDAFYSGDMTGTARNMARVTVQHAGMKLYHLPYNLYASYVFGSDDAPKELPNVKSVQWARSKDQDFATATITFYNTAPLDLGDTPTRDLDGLGQYTYNRGRTQYASRWGQRENAWADVLMPDNILRTYEGYGFDPTVIPELDSFLVSTGVWRIDDVEFTHTGLITVTCRDIGSILADQMIFPPIVPKSYWPLSFTTDNAKVGFIGPSVNSKTQDTASVSRPSSWHGPVVGPATTSVSSGSNQLTVSWTRPSTADSSSYKVVGYQVAIDGVLMSTVYKASARSATVKTGIHNGNVYSVGVIALWQDKNGNKARSNFGTLPMARPHAVTTTAVTPGSVQLNVNEAGVLRPNYVRFAYTGTGKYRVVAYKSHSTSQITFSVELTGSGTAHVDTGGRLGDLTEWNYLLYGTDADGKVGSGEVFFAGIDGAFFGAPGSGASPADTKVSGATVTTKSGTTKPLKPVNVALAYNDSSNDYYVGAGSNVSVYGHKGSDAFDGDPGTYWMSIGNQRNDQGYSYEWLEASCANVTLTSVSVQTRGKHYGVYVSVFSDGKWVQHSNTGVIPYNPDLPESHNHANIPYAEFKHEGDSESITIDLRAAIPNVTRVRVTLHNLQYFGETSPYKYRAAVRHLTAKGQTGNGNGSGVRSAETSVTTYIPAHINPGLGANPGLYKDYTDIVKLLLAWGGFYWPQDAQLVLSDGSIEQFAIGLGPYGLPDVDPVLGDIDGGRIWGDLETTGTAGAAGAVGQLATQIWTQKSLMDGISYIRDIVGYTFFIDEDGAVVWRRPNYFAIGNWIGNDAPVGTPARYTNVVVIDEEQTLVGLTAKLTGRNVRERVFVATTDGKTGALALGYNPNPTGLRRVGGWTDQYFASAEECRVMADLIAVQQLFSYRTDVVTIHGYPAIQVDDQVLLVEQVTSEGYYHYVKSIDSNNDLESGSGWTYGLGTQWLGERPFDQWAFNPADLSEETQTYLDAYDYGTIGTLPDGTV